VFGGIATATSGTTTLCFVIALAATAEASRSSYRSLELAA
jgi:hypothetical protein